MPTPLKRANFILIVVSPSLKTGATPVCEDCQGALSATPGLAPGVLGIRRARHRRVRLVLNRVFVTHLSFGHTIREPGYYKKGLFAERIPKSLAH